MCIKVYLILQYTYLFPYLQHISSRNTVDKLRTYHAGSLLTQSTTVSKHLYTCKGKTTESIQ